MRRERRTKFWGAGCTTVVPLLLLCSFKTISAQTGQLKVCKASGTGVAAGLNFSFTVAGASLEVKSGSCAMAAGSFSIGISVTVSETPSAGTTLSAIGVVPPSQLLSVNLPGRSVSVSIGTGVTEVDFTNTVGGLGLLKVCKIAGTGVAIGSNSSFVMGGASFTVPAGYCVNKGTFPVGTVVTITEVISPQAVLSAISVVPTSQQGTVDLANQVVTATIGVGVTEVRFTNVGASLSSCVGSGAMGVLVKKPNVTAYIPKGTWVFGGQLGVQAVPIEPVPVATPKSIAPVPANKVNSCASNSVSGQTVCVGSGTDVYLITGSALTQTLSSGATGFAHFSGGSCQTCGVAIDAVHNEAVIEVGLSTSPSGSGIQVLDLANNQFFSPFPLNHLVSEDIQIDPFRNLYLSPSETNAYDVITRSAPNVLAEYSNPVPVLSPGEMDAAAEDCTTGIALSSVEQSGDLFISDLTQINYGGATWSAPGQLVHFPEFTSFGHGTNGIAVAPGSHLAFVTGEFQDINIGVVQLPLSSGVGTPNFGDYASAVMPRTPDGTFFGAGYDPHTMTAYVSPNDGRAYGLFANIAPSDWVAVVDLEKLLNAPRTLSTHFVDPSYDLVANGVVRFVRTF